jgi:hypothetical protein
MPKCNLSLVDGIVYSIMNPAAMKRFFGSSYLTFQRYLGCYQIAFETGIVLGYAFRERLATFAKLFSQPGREENVIAFLQEIAQRALREAEEPKSFLDLGMFAEKSRIETKDLNVTEAKINRQKLSLDSSFKLLQSAVTLGIGFGSAFPEMTEQLWHHQYGRAVNSDEWAKVKKAGLDIPEQPTGPMILAERQAQLVSVVEQYVSEAHPDLLPRLQMQR